MAGGVKFTLVSDVRSMLTGMQDAEKALDDVAGSMDDLAADAQKAGRKTGDELADGVEGGTDRVVKSFREMARDVAKHTKDTGKSLGDDINDGADRAESGLDDFKEEAAGTARETAASFSGSADDIAGSFQEIAANALAGFGPIGSAAGLALAAGFGTLYTRITEDAAKAEQRVSDMYDDFLESGKDYLSKEYITDELTKIYKGADDAVIKIDQLRDLATTADVSEPLLARALVGDQAARDELAREISSKELAITTAIDEALERGENLNPAFSPAIGAIREINDQLQLVAGSADEAELNARNAAAAISGIDVSRAAASAEDARAKFDGLGRTIESLPDATISVDLDTSKATETYEAWVRGIRARGGVSVPIKGLPQPV